MPPLRLVSLLAANADTFYRALAAYMFARLSAPVGFADGVPWEERLRRLDAGEAEVAALCGLLYTQRIRDVPAPLALLAAPVYAEARYARQPVYFSDVIAPATSRYEDFAALRGANLAYNDVGSFSGYALVRAELAARGERAGFFGNVVEAGSHQAAIALVAACEADAAAIDSIVLAQELREKPWLAARLRVVASLGPNPAPPLAASTRLPAELRAQIQEALLTMHCNAEGRALLQAAQLARFAPARDADYDAIRAVARAAEGVALTRQSA